jgi:hypothetical protein
VLGALSSRRLLKKVIKISISIYNILTFVGAWQTVSATTEANESPAVIYRPWACLPKVGRRNCKGATGRGFAHPPEFRKAEAFPRGWKVTMVVVRLQV